MTNHQLTPHEVRVLRMLNGELTLEYGAWVNACLEFLSTMGYCTKSPNYRITLKGLEYLDSLDKANETRT